MNQTLLSPAIPSIGNSLDVSTTTIQWVISGYLLINALVVPLCPFFISKFKTNILLIFISLLFLFGCILMSVSNCFLMFMIGRIMQAIAAGLIIPGSVSLLMVTGKKNSRGKALGTFGLISSIGPALGPALSGVIVEYLSWNWIYYLLSIICAVLVVVSVFTTKPIDSIHDKSNNTIDIISVILCSLGIVLVFGSLDIIQSYGISIWAIIILALGILFVVLFCKRQNTIGTPLLKVSLLKIRSFRIPALYSVIINGSGMCNAILTPILIQTIFGYSTLVSGLIVTPGTLLCIAANPIVGTLSDKIGVRAVSLFGCFFVCLSSLGMAIFEQNWHILLLCLILTIRSIAIVMVIRSLPALATKDLKVKDLPHGNSLYITLNSISGAVFTTLLILIGYTVFYLTAGHIEIANMTAELAAELFAVRIIFWVQTLICAIIFVLIFKNIKNKYII